MNSLSIDNETYNIIAKKIYKTALNYLARVEKNEYGDNKEFFILSLRSRNPRANIIQLSFVIINDIHLCSSLLILLLNHINV
jgi:hypothetical protein